MRTMKRMVRRLLPARVYNALRRAVHTRRLNRVPAIAVNLDSLPRAAEISFPEMLGDDDIAAGYKKARSAIDKVLPDVPGSHSIGREERRAIYGLIRHFQPRSVLEIGTNRGASTLHIAMAMREYRNGNAAPQLITVDLFDVNNPPVAEAKRYCLSTPPYEMLARLNCADLVEFVVASSLNYLVGREAEFDFIFVDHGASADVVYQDIPLVLTALRPGGHLLMNSYFPDGKPLGAGGIALPGAWLAVRRLHREGVGLVALPYPTATGGSSLAILARD